MYMFLSIFTPTPRERGGLLLWAAEGQGKFEGGWRGYWPLFLSLGPPNMAMPLKPLFLSVQLPYHSAVLPLPQFQASVSVPPPSRGSPSQTPTPSRLSTIQGLFGGWGGGEETSTQWRFPDPAAKFPSPPLMSPHWMFLGKPNSKSLAQAPSPMFQGNVWAYHPANLNSLPRTEEYTPLQSKRPTHTPLP